MFKMQKYCKTATWQNLFGFINGKAGKTSYDNSYKESSRALSLRSQTWLRKKKMEYCFAFRSPCTTLPLRGQDRRRLGNGNKKLRVLFRIPLALHYLCSQKEKDGYYPYHITPTSRGGDFQYADRGTTAQPHRTHKRHFHRRKSQSDQCGPGCRL